MKRMGLALLAVLLSAPLFAAAPFGLLSGVEQRDEVRSPAALLRRMVSDGFVCVGFSNDLGDGEDARYKELIRLGYQDWFSYTLSVIEKSGRAEEFADLMPVLETPVSVRFTGENCDQPDLLFRVIAQTSIAGACRGRALACVDRFGDVPVLYFYPYKGVKNWFYGGMRFVLTHELGHTMGMADQYKYGRANSSDRFHTPDAGRGVMSSAKPGAGFKCDDADGFINLLDVGVFGNRRGGDEGWRSLCKRRNYSYVEGRPTVNGRYAVDLMSLDEKDPTVAEFDENGLLKSERSYRVTADGVYNPFDRAPAVERQLDAKGRLIYERNNKGEEMFCSYTYERKSCMVVKGDLCLAQILDLERRFGRRMVLLQYVHPARDAVEMLFESTRKSRRVYYSDLEQRYEFLVDRSGRIAPPKQEGGRNINAARSLSRGVASVGLDAVSRKAERALADEQVRAIQRDMERFYQMYVKKR